MSESPFEMLPLVTVATFSTTWEAQIAQARLASEDIHSLIADEHLIRMVALSNALGGVHLQVRSDQAQTASEVLRRAASLPEIYLVGPDPEAAAARCPGCGSGELLPERTSKLLLGVLPLSRKAYRCGTCGALWRAAEVDSHTHPPQAQDESEDLEEREERPPGASDSTVVARFHTPWEAHLARTLLESEGLRACVVEQPLPAVNLLSNATTPGNRLEVRQDDASRASVILSRAFGYPARVVPADDEPLPG